MSHRAHGRLALASIEHPPIPTGWYLVAESQELKPGQALPLRRFGHDVALFRGEDGVAHMLDAHCPHLGANLARGGKVVGDSLRCPFHGWCFDGSGTCVEIPYAKRIPPRATVAVWDVCEKNGAIWGWYAEDGSAPTWQLPVIEELSASGWVAQERSIFTIHAHAQDMAENGVDSAHLHTLHGMAQVPVQKVETDGPVMTVRSQIKYPEHLGSGEGLLTTTHWGVAASTARFTGVVETFLWVTVKSIDVNHNEVQITPLIRDLGNAEITATVGALFVKEVVSQFATDIPIWEDKVMWRQPVLCEGDGPIAPFRRWMRQFYVRKVDEIAPVEESGSAAG